MRMMIDSSSWIWPISFVFAGAGSTFLGPFLPRLATSWRLLDHQAGFLVSSLFLGSFTGTLLLSPKLRRTVFVGSLSACIGLLLFAVCVERNLGILVAVASITVMGFGLGQLMSSINLLVGSAEGGRRARRLAWIAAAFCLGAILSPVLTTVVIRGLSVSARLALFAPLFLLPLLWASRRELSDPRSSVETHTQGLGPQAWHTAWRCIVLFLIYGGVEASVVSWMPMVAARYQLGTLGKAQWITSIFWMSLSASRMVMALLQQASREVDTLRASTIGAALSLVWLIAAPSPVALILTCMIAGVCLGPIFPLLLSSSIGYGLSERALGMALAACGLGAAVFPSILGIVASAGSLRGAMMVPIVGLCLLLILRWWPQRNTITLNPQVTKVTSV